MGLDTPVGTARALFVGVGPAGEKRVAGRQTALSGVGLLTSSATCSRYGCTAVVLRSLRSARGIPLV